MDYSKMIKIVKKNTDIIDFGEFGRGSSGIWIKKAQERLGVKFPPSYIWWLKAYSGGEINGEEIFSVYELDFDEVIGGDIVYINELNRKNENVSNQKLVIQENDQGESYYFNLDIVDDDGESPVYSDFGNRKYADNFFEFIFKKVDE